MIKFKGHITRFSKNFFWLVSFQGLGYLFSFLSIPLLISKFGYEKSGYVFTVQALVLGLSALSNYSLNFYIPTQSKKISTDKNVFRNMWKLTISVRLLFSVLLSVITVVVCSMFFSDFLLFWVLSLLILFSKIFSPNLFFNAIEKNDKILVIGVLSKLLFLVILWFLKSYTYVNFFFGLTELFILFILLKSEKEPFVFEFVSLTEVQNFIKKTYSLFLINLFSIIKSASILPLISYLFGSSYATIYTLADKIINVFRGISGASFTGFYPILNKENIQKSVLSIKNLFFLFLFSVLLTVFLWFVSPEMIYLLNNFSENQQAVEVLRILLFTIPVSFVTIPFFSVLLNLKKWKLLMWLNLIQVICLFILYGFFHQTIYQLVISFVLTEYFILIGYFFSSRNNIIITKTT